MKKKQRCFLNRFAALVAALMLSFSLVVPCFASDASMPTKEDFYSHPFSWFVWRSAISSSSGQLCYELICSPLVFSSGAVISSGLPYSFEVNTYSFYDPAIDGDFYQYGFSTLAEPRGSCGPWSLYPSFPIGTELKYNLATFRVYGDSVSYQSFYGAVCPSPESLSISSEFKSLKNLDGFPVTSFGQKIYPVVRGPYTTGNTHANNWVVFSGLDNGCVASENSVIGLVLSAHYCPVVTNGYIALGVTGWQDVSYRFPDDYSFSSSDARFWLLNPSAVTGSFSGNFGCSLIVPATLLPSDVQPGDWISHGTMDKLQDQLVNDFNVDSSTLKNSKDNLNSWSSTSSVDSDVATGATGLLNGLFQNLGTFLFSVSLLCFGAVVLRMLIRKAVDG